MGGELANNNNLFDKFNDETKSYLIDVLNWVNSLSDISIGNDSLSAFEIWFLALTLSLNNISKYKNVFTSISDTKPKNNKYTKNAPVPDACLEAIEPIVNDYPVLSQITPIEVYHNYLSNNIKNIKNCYRFIPGMKSYDFNEFKSNLEKYVSNNSKEQVSHVTVSKEKGKLTELKNISKEYVHERSENLKEKHNTTPVNKVNLSENFYSNLSLDLHNDLTHIGQIYTYLKKNNVKSKYNIFSNKYYISLALLLSGSKNNNYVYKFYLDNCIDYEKICECCGVNPKDLENLTELDLEAFAEQMSPYIINRSYETNIDNIVNDFVEMNTDSLLNRLYSFVKAKNIRGDFNSYILNYYKNIEKEKLKKEKAEAEKQQELDKKNDIENIKDNKLFHIIQYACEIIEYYDGFERTDDEIGLSALLIAIIKYTKAKELDIYYYLADNGLTDEGLRISCDIDCGVFNYDVYKKYLKKFIKDDMYDTIENVITDKDTNLKLLFYNIKCSEKEIKSRFANLKEQFEAYNKMLIENAAKEEINSIVENMKNADIFDLFANATRVYKLLKDNNMKDGNDIDEPSIADASILISYLLSDDVGVKFMNKHGVTIENIEKYLKIDDIKKKLSDIKTDLSILTLDDFGAEIDTYNDENVTNLGLEIYNCDCLSDEILKIYGKDYDNLEEELTSGKEIVSMEETIERLNNSEIEEIEDSVASAMKYGNALSEYSDCMNNLFKNIMSDNLLDVFDENMNYNLLEKLNKKQKTQGIGTCADDYEIISKSDFELLVEDISNIKKDVESQIDRLLDELVHFNNLKRFYELYILKLEKYILKAETKVQEIDKKLSNLDENDIDYLDYSSMKEILELKIDSFKQAQIISRSEYVKVLNILTNHNSLLQSLVTTKDVVLPTISSESIISLGLKRENVIAQINMAASIMAKNSVEQGVTNIKENASYLKDLNKNKDDLDDSGHYILRKV